MPMKVERMCLFRGCPSSQVTCPSNSSVCSSPSASALPCPSIRLKVIYPYEILYNDLNDSLALFNRTITQGGRTPAAGAMFLAWSALRRGVTSWVQRQLAHSSAKRKIKKCCVHKSVAEMKFGQEMNIHCSVPSYHLLHSLCDSRKFR